MTPEDPPARQPSERRTRAARGRPAPENVGSKVVGASQLLTGVGTLLAGLAAIVAIVVSNGGGGGGQEPLSPGPFVTASATPESSAPAPSASEASTSPRTDTTILFRDSLHGLVPGMFEGVYGGCAHQFDEGYHIAVVAREAQGIICADSLEDVAANLEALISIHVEVTVGLIDSQPSTSTVFGPGDAGILCRMRGTVSTGDYYVGSYSPTGYWEIDRFDAGEQKRLSSGVAVDLTTERGASRRIGLDCLGDPGARTVVRFSVDGRIIGSVVDAVGLAPGSVGLGATGYPGGSLEVAFEDLEVETR